MTWQGFGIMMMGLILALGTLGIPSAGHSSMIYQRGMHAPTQKKSNRFLYLNPNYRPRQPDPYKPCTQNGRALCLTKQAPPNPYVRHPNGIPLPPKVHPYIRKIFKPKTHRYH